MSRSSWTFGIEGNPSLASLKDPAYLWRVLPEQPWWRSVYILNARDPSASAKAGPLSEIAYLLYLPVDQVI